jgi:ABC-type multidrug transport system fused ATPase/permease subunit
LFGYHKAHVFEQPQLFSGTIRSNLDPFEQYEDNRLWDALRRSYLLGSGAEEDDEKATLREGEVSNTRVARFNLDTVIEDDGANLSVGERSLLSLARALVKDSRVVIMDEAT